VVFFLYNPQITKFCK